MSEIKKREIVLSGELLRAFAYDCFDVIIRDIKAREEQEKEEASTEENCRKSA